MNFWFSGLHIDKYKYLENFDANAKIVLLDSIIMRHVAFCLESKDSGNLYFCFRWLLIWFKREFSFCDICSLWEVLWTRLPSPNFHLFICLSMLDLEKSHIMAKDFEFTEILKVHRTTLHIISIELFSLQSQLGKQSFTQQGFFSQFCSVDVFHEEKYEF